MPLNCLARPTIPATSVAPLIVPWFPWPERSFIFPSAVRVSMSYARMGSPTMRVNPEVRVIVPSVAWGLMEYVPAGVLEDVAKRRFAVHVALHEGGVNVQAVPEGRFVQEYWRVW